MCMYLASFQGSSLLAIDRAGQRSYVKLLRGRREEPGTEATCTMVEVEKITVTFR